MTSVSLNDILFANQENQKAEEEDFYKILGCSIYSNKNQITTEYRKKALLCHPDKSKEDEETRRKFELLQEAYKVLSDDQERKIYDSWYNSSLLISWKTWKELDDEKRNSYHWNSSKPQQTITTSSNHSQNSNPQQSYFQQNDSADSLISKFRNYEI